MPLPFLHMLVSSIGRGVRMRPADGQLIGSRSVDETHAVGYDFSRGLVPTTGAQLRIEG